MTIEEFTKSYVSKEEYERMALECLIRTHLDSNDVITIKNILYRADITSIKDLYVADEDRIIRIRNCGFDRFKKIMTLKDIIIRGLEGV